MKLRSRHVEQPGAELDVDGHAAMADGAARAAQLGGVTNPAAQASLAVFHELRALRLQLQQPPMVNVPMPGGQSDVWKPA